MLNRAACSLPRKESTRSHLTLAFTNIREALSRCGPASQKRGHGIRVASVIGVGDH